MSEAKHAATPWAVEYDTDKSPNIWIHAEENAGIAKVEVCDYDDGQGHRLTDEDHANAEFIVRACNAHDDLLEALRSAEAYIDADLEVLRDSFLPNPSEDEARHLGLSEMTLKKIQAVIAKAEGR